jgi:hypothetical protein
MRRTLKLLSIGLITSSLAIALAQIPGAPADTNPPVPVVPSQVAPTSAPPAAPVTNPPAVTPLPSPTDLAPAVVTQPAIQPPPQQAPPPKPKPPVNPSYSGKLVEVDRTAMTLTLTSRGKEQTFLITANTRFQKKGKPAILADGIPDEQVVVTAKPGKKGKQEALYVRFGGK